MALTTLPTPPSTASPNDFDDRADAFVAALPTMVTEINAVLPTIDSAAASAATASAAAAAALAATGYVASSVQSLSLTTGSKTTNLVETGKSFAVNDAVTLVRRSNANARMRGSVTAFTAGSGAMTTNVTLIPGDTGGPFTDWVVMLTVFEPPFTVELQDFAIAAATAL